MSINDYVEERNNELKEAYAELGNKVYWKDRYGNAIQVRHVADTTIHEILEMLDRVNPESFWITIFEQEIKDRFVDGIDKI